MVNKVGLTTAKQLQVHPICLSSTQTNKNKWKEKTKRKEKRPVTKKGESESQVGGKQKEN